MPRVETGIPGRHLVIELLYSNPSGPALKAIVHPETISTPTSFLRKKPGVHGLL
jgi:hypothetical protein